MGRISATVAGLESALAAFRWFRGMEMVPRGRLLVEGDEFLARGADLSAVVSTLEARAAFNRLQHLTSPLRRAKVAGSLLSGIEVNHPRKTGSAEEYLSERFGGSVTAQSVVAGLTRGFRGIGSVKMEIGPPASRLSLRLYDRSGDFFGEVDHYIVPDNRFPGFWMREDGWVGVPPGRRRGKGIGTRIFVNSVVLMAQTGRFSRYQFRASLLGPAAWAFFGGIKVGPDAPTRARAVLRRLNHDYGLGLGREIDTAVTFEQVRDLRLKKDPSTELLLHVKRLFERHESRVGADRLWGLTQSIGLVALLNAGPTGFLATLDIRPGSEAYQEFLLSLSALRRRGKFRFTAP